MTKRRISEQTAHEVSRLWDCEAVPLLRYAMVLTGGAQPAAEDLVQRVFMAVARQWEELSASHENRGARTMPVGRYRPWLRRVCRNLWIDDIRQTQRSNRLDADLAHNGAVSPPDPADVVLARDALERCWAVIRSFPERRRQVALLYFVEQRTTTQISELLGIEPSGVRKHVALARAALRHTINGSSVTEPATVRREDQA